VGGFSKRPKSVSQKDNTKKPRVGFMISSHYCLCLTLISKPIFSYIHIDIIVSDSKVPAFFLKFHPNYRKLLHLESRSAFFLCFSNLRHTQLHLAAREMLPNGTRGDDSAVIPDKRCLTPRAQIRGSINPAELTSAVVLPESPHFLSYNGGFRKNGGSA